MFVISFKLNKSKIVLAIIIIIIVAVISTFGYYILSTREEIAPEVPTAAFDINESSMAISFIQQLGWEVDKSPSEFEEFQIPKEFDVVYKRYNEYQRDINSNLNDYKGKMVKRYTYKLKNYKLSEKYKNQQVYADVIVFNGKVIAGDIKTNELEGFMVSLKGRTFKEITGIEEDMYR